MHLKLTNITSSKIVCGLQIKGGVCHFYQRSKKNSYFLVSVSLMHRGLRKKPYVHCPFDQLMKNPLFTPQSETCLLFSGWEKVCHRSKEPISQAIFGMDPSHPTPCSYKMTNDTVSIPVKASDDDLVDRNQNRNIRVVFTVGNVTKEIAIIKVHLIRNENCYSMSYNEFVFL